MSDMKFRLGDSVEADGEYGQIVEVRAPGTRYLYLVELESGSVIPYLESELSPVSAPPESPR